MAYPFRQGWTERIRGYLTHDDLLMSLTGYTLALVGTDGTGAAISFTSPKVGVVDAGTGLVYYDPDITDFTVAKSPIRVRWKVTIAGRDAYFPNHGPIVWLVEYP